MDPGSVVGLVKSCYTIGVQIVKLCSTWKHADSEVEQSVLIFKSCWTRTELQVNFVMRIEDRMDEDHRRMMHALLRQLKHTLSIATNKLEGGDPKELINPNTIDGIISDLENWQRRFDPSWFILMTIADTFLDRVLDSEKATERELRGPATAAKGPLALAAGLRQVMSVSAETTANFKFLQEVQMEWKDIPFSDAKAGYRYSNDPRWYIVDTIKIRKASQARDVRRDVRALAIKLAQADPLAFGLFNCRGVVPVTRRGYPFASHPQLGSEQQGMETLKSLRAMLLSPDQQISLSWKMLMACELGKAVNYVHTFDFVHKNIRPGVGPLWWHSHGGDKIWAHNVYRHPDRQGNNPSSKYTMRHDIYSLGVCLLEIGLWESFVDYTNESEFHEPPQPRFSNPYFAFIKWWKEKGENAIHRLGIAAQGISGETGTDSTVSA
ncbi:hypothetical protein N7493_005808 [Penicillium malachiteum]|uniref:Protein kinase domain-containing protein n=1 Tax=Penicillium malachiteum TaxID=1324776 RepID=A0AAD6HLX6_9EURO|nr:hypothetical protein N7493_005808 [Penicillium malachiteum]